MVANIVDDGEKFFGEWTEPEACVEFDRRITECGLFRSHAEVVGHYLAARTHRKPQSARVDRILVPTDKLRAAGWRTIIGVEIKASGLRCGHAVSQAIDYTYAAFEVGGNWVHPEMIFLWPLREQMKSIKSVVVQNGIGEVFDTASDLLVFNSEHGLIRAHRDGTVTVKPHVAGRKVGSR